VSLLTRNVFDREPLKIDVGLDHIEERELSPRAQRAACSEGKRALTFRCFVDHHEKFALVPLGEDLALSSCTSLPRRFGRLGRGGFTLFRHRTMLPLTAERCPGGNTGALQSGKIDSMTFEVVEIDNLEGCLMGRAKDHARRFAGLERLAPARRAQAPSVAGLQSREVEFRLWR
jgi:hypothetical protein